MCNVFKYLTFPYCEMRSASCNVYCNVCATCKKFRFLYVFVVPHVFWGFFFENAGNTDTRNSDTRNTGTGNTDTRNIDTRNTGTGNTDTRNTDTKNSNIRNTGFRNIPARSKSRVVILGDSMIKRLNPRQLQNGINCKVAIKTFPGTGIDDMVHYVRPTVSTRPDEIILHIGTNDLKNKSPETFAESVVNLGNSIKRENNEIKLILSSIIK